MQPFLHEAAQIKGAVVDLKEQLRKLKKEKADKKELKALDTTIKGKENDGRARAAKDLPWGEGRWRHSGLTT